MKIAFVTTYDGENIKHWSGTSFHISKTLTCIGYQVYYIKNLKQKISFFERIKIKCIALFSDKQFDIDRYPSVAKNYAKQVKKQIQPHTDIIFAPSTIPIAWLETPIPKVIYIDATFNSMLDFYPEFKILHPNCIFQGEFLEKKSLDTAQMIFLSSSWAVNSAINHYRIPHQKIKEIPFGSNFEFELQRDEIIQLISSKKGPEIHLLFVGVNWERKGGNKALAIQKELNNKGIITFLHCVGTAPIESHINVISYGFIDKNSSSGILLLTSLYKKCHFLILPTLADCTPIVISEANSFGVPCLSHDIGGIPSILLNNINGNCFEITSSIEEWVKFIITNDPNQPSYERLALSCYQFYSEKLNWTKIGIQIKSYLKDL